MATPAVGPVRQPGTFQVAYSGRGPLPDLTTTIETSSSPAFNDATILASIGSDPGRFVTNDQLGTVFATDAAIDTRYETFTGLYICPVAGPPGTPAEIIQVHAPYMTRNVQWTEEHSGGKAPRLPSSVPTGSNETLGYSSIVLAAPIPSPEGVYVYRTSGLYTFLLTSLPSSGADLPAGKLPFDLQSAAQHGLAAAQFDSTLIPGT